MLREFFVCDVGELECTGKVLGLNVGENIILMGVSFWDMIGK